jgi:hypothetical protein
MRALALVVILVVLPAGTALGQWWVGVEIATARYAGSARDTSNGGGPPAFRPGDATMVGVRAGRTLAKGNVSLAFRASLGTPGLAGTGGDLTVIDRSVGQLIELVTLVAVRVGGIGPSGAIRAELGPALHLWDVGDETRSRFGAVGAVAYEWPVTGGARFSGAIHLEGALSRSWFDAGDLPPEYERRTTRRYGVTLGLRYLFSRQHPAP